MQTASGISNLSAQPPQKIFPNVYAFWGFAILATDVPLCAPQQPHVHVPSENGVRSPSPWDMVFEALLLLCFCQLVNVP